MGGCRGGDAAGGRVGHIAMVAAITFPLDDGFGAAEFEPVAGIA